MYELPAVVRRAVVGGVGVVDPQSVGERPEVIGQLFVGGLGVRPHRVAADRRDDDRVQDRGTRRAGDEGDVGVPHVRPGSRQGVELEHVRVARDRRHGGVRHRRRPEAPRERDVRLRVEELVAEEQHLVFDERRGDPAGVDWVGVEWPRQIDVTDLCSDPAGQGFDVEFGGGGDGVHASSLAPQLGKPD